MRLVSCLVHDHDLAMVLLAALMCLIGVLATIKLYRRAMLVDGIGRLGWIFTAAVTSGASIWTAHFIAMLGYEVPFPVTFEPVLTFISLLIAIVGSALAFWLTLAFASRAARQIGGATFGLAVAAMHYVGMFAFRVDGPVAWRADYLAASLVAAVLLSALALAAARRWQSGARRYIAVAAMFLCVILLHFLGMAAFVVEPLQGIDVAADTAAFDAMAIAVFCAALVVICTGLCTAIIDTHTKVSSQQELRVMAMRDPLTGLPNRADFERHLDGLLASAAGRRSVAVIGIDLNRFKEINDTWGHGTGDEALCVLGGRLVAIVQSGGYVARMGGDEFSAVLEFGERAELDHFLATLHERLCDPIPLDHTIVRTGASIGVAMSPDHGTDRAELVSNADVAMYCAKNDPAQDICFYDEALGEATRGRIELLRELRIAVEFGGLDVHYQVQRSVSSGRISGYEALVRWTHPTLGRIPPSEFIPLAEMNGLIIPLGTWVLWRACRDAARWSDPCKVAVNLSAVQLMDPGLPEVVTAILRDTGLPPDRLELELTETAVIQDKARSLEAIERIRALGVTIALDDFGTGYSSLDTLRSFPFDKIKLDRAFVEGLEQDERSMAIVQAVLALGKSLKVPVLAEGIETSRQLALLRAQACDEAQGYLLGRPGPMPEESAADDDQAEAG